MNRINNIQALRGIRRRICGASAYRVPGALVPGFGRRGVDIFFVISGFIMASVCTRETAGLFAKRRLIPILPLYWFFTVLRYILSPSCLDVVRSPTRVEVSMLIKSLLFIPYVAPDHTLYPILFVGWTLDLEMFFYVLLVIGLIVSRKHATIFASLCLLYTYALYFHLTGAGSLYGDPRMLQFVLGAGCYEAYKRTSRRLPLTSALGGAIGFVLMFIPQIPAAIPSTLIVLSAALLSKSGSDTNSKLLIFIGEASYVLYVTHGWIFDVGFDTHMLNDDSHLLNAGIALLVSCAVSIAIHKWVEAPGIKALSHYVLRRQPQLAPG